MGEKYSQEPRLKLYHMVIDMGGSCVRMTERPARYDLLCGRQLAQGTGSGTQAKSTCNGDGRLVRNGKMGIALWIACVIALMAARGGVIMRDTFSIPAVHH